MSCHDTTSLLGRRFGRLTVLERDLGRGCRKDVWWTVKCDCGTTPFAALAGRLRHGVTKHCGCLGGAGISAETRRRREEGGLETDSPGHPRGRGGARNPLDDPETLPGMPPETRKRARERIAWLLQEVDKVPKGKLE